MYNTPNQVRRLAIVAGFVLAGIIVCVIIYNQFVRPHINISAPSGSTVSIFSLNDGHTIVQKQLKGNSGSYAVSSGSYTVVISGSNGGQVFYASVAPLQSKSFRYSAATQRTAVTVARQVAYNVVAGPQAISYLDTTKRVIEHMDENGNVVALDTSTPVASLNDSNTGNAQGLYPVKNNQAIAASGGHLYILKNNQLTPLNITGLPSPISRLTIGANQLDDSFVIGVNQTIYWYSSVDAAPVKLLTLDKRFDSLAYGGNKVIAYSSRMPLAVEDIRYAYTAYAIDPVVIDTQTHKQSTLTTGPANSASISPDGSMATLTLQNAGSTSIYDLKQSKQLYSVENPDTAVPVWIDTSHLLYGKRGSVWSFDTTAKSAVILGTLPDSNEPTSITIDSASGDYYVTSYATDDTAAIYRLTTSVADINASRAASLDTPQQNNIQFQLTYVNITRPTLLVTTSVVSGNPTESVFKALTLQSRQASITYMRAYGVDPSRLIIIYDPANP